MALIINCNWPRVFKALAKILGFVLVLWFIAISPLNRPLYEFVLFHPSKFPIGFYNIGTVDNIKPRDVFFKSKDGAKLHGWLFSLPKSRITVILSHGNGGNLTHRTQLIDLLLQAKASVFAYDYHGYGRSEGKPSIDNACDDARAAYDYLTNVEHLPWRQIALLGESLGTGITGRLSTDVKCAGIILISPLLSLANRAGEILPFFRIYPNWLYPQGGLDNLSIFKNAHPPLLIIAGTEDHTLPINHADTLYECASQPKTYLRIEGAGHGDAKMMYSPLLAGYLSAFIERL
jgi:alpha-beta hydrolase superfamily lysophospholipase